ncbi:cytolysin VCC [Kistimonas scapharcae]|uniref:Cytolysin VCC n=1 Tax=Kistimonas scapharcae TaxID=1036133 RepID=A0ABP8V0Z1_9GAMM
MSVSLRKTFLCLLALTGSIQNSSATNIDEDHYIVPTGQTVNVIHIVDLLNVAADSESVYNTLRHHVIDEGEKYLIDVVDKQASRSVAEMRKAVQNLFGIAFDQDRLMVSRYKEQMLYTPYNSQDDITLPELIENLDAIELRDQARSMREYRTVSSPDEQTSLPHLAFYINMFHPMTSEECTFPTSYIWPEKGTSNFCERGNISLIYRVNWERSLQYGTTGSATPDAKIVRITLDDDVSGAGIHLNSRLGHRVTKPGYTGVNSWYRDWSTDVYAQSYELSIKASNDKASILKTTPSSNINPQYEKTETSGFSLGVSAELGTENTQEGAKGLLIPIAAYEQNRTLTFSTEEYSIQKATPSDREVLFTWERSEYASRDSLLSKGTDPVFDSYVTYPVDTSKISPIAYSNFTPRLDVIYKANSQESGTTTFSLDTSVQARPLYTGAFLYFYLIGAHVAYEAFETDHLDQYITAHAGFTVDWNHPVFTGGYPVNLQLGSFNNLCLSYDNDFNLSPQECSLISKHQAFIYDAMGRYLSTLDTTMCLDGDDMSRLNRCDARLSQRWQWLESSDYLQNTRSCLLLAHDTDTGQLQMRAMDTEDNDTTSLRTLTSFTTIYNTPKCHYWLDTPNNMGQVGDIYRYDDYNEGITEYFRLLTPVYGAYPDEGNNSDWESLGQATACHN